MVFFQYCEMYMTINEITNVKAQTRPAHKPNQRQSPQQRKRARETDFEKNSKEFAAKKRALKPKSPQ